MEAAEAAAAETAKAAALAVAPSIRDGRDAAAFMNASNQSGSRMPRAASATAAAAAAAAAAEDEAGAEVAFSLRRRR